MKTKIIANYLPQYHSIPENDLWWGKGYTDWVAVKHSKPLFHGHKQPKIPLNNNYYDLSTLESIKFQVDLANKYGIYGFGIYHYWFSSELHLLDRPAQLIRENANVDIHYMFIWDNSSWKRTWSNVDFANDWAPMFDGNLKNQKNGYLAELKYGDEVEWRTHFEYLLPFFKDERYIKIGEKPMFGFFCPDNNSELVQNMVSFWNKIAPEYGIPGVFCCGRKVDGLGCYMDADFLYEPHWSGWVQHGSEGRVNNFIKRLRHKIFNQPMIDNYKKIWEKIISNAKNYADDAVFYSGFVSYDDTPRRGVKGRVVHGASPMLFEKYFKELLKLSEKTNKEYLFLTAWNEWGEGAYLEPDEENGYAYLETIKRVIDSSIRDDM